jgi:uncharacterized protein
MNDQDQNIVSEYMAHIANKSFPCIAAKAALSENHIKTFVANHLACPNDDQHILDFLYEFVDLYRASKEFYHSAVVIFKGPMQCDEEVFDEMLWNRLQAISNLDAQRYRWDTRVDRDAQSPNFSYSIKEEAFYIIALHSNSSRKARQFKYATLVFNPHEQFQKLRALNRYLPMRHAVRKRDVKLSGSVNPMLADFGESSEVFQYSGKRYDSKWKCPFVSKHENEKCDSSS